MTTSGLQLGRTLSTLLQVTEAELPANPDSFGYYNVFHMGIGTAEKLYGERIPAVYVNKDKFISIASGISNNYNNYQNYDYTLNQWYHIEILQKENSNGKIIYSIEIDGLTVHEVVNTQPQIFEKVILYTSDPFYPSFAPFGELKNLNIANLDKFPA